MVTTTPVVGAARVPRSKAIVRVERMGKPICTVVTCVVFPCDPVSTCDLLHTCMYSRFGTKICACVRGTPAAHRVEVFPAFPDYDFKAGHFIKA